MRTFNEREHLTVFVRLICSLLLTIFRVILDRCPVDIDDMWSSLDFTIHDSKRELVDSNATATATTTVKKEWYIYILLFINKLYLLIIIFLSLSF